MRHFRLFALVLSFILVGCSQIETSIEQKRLQATQQAELYPWIYYPIDEESKAALCEALQVPDNDRLCLEGVPVMHQDVVEKVKNAFPVNQTAYNEVESKLENFPHSSERIRQSDGTLVDVGYVYRLTNYQGACITFLINSEDKIIEKITASSVGSGPIPTTCGPTK